MIQSSQQPFSHSTPSSRWPRHIIAGHLQAWAREKDSISQRGFADAYDLPRSSLRDWQNRQDSIMDHPEAKAFFDSPVGLAVLHRILIAAHVVVTFRGGNGVQLVSEFLELSALALYVAPSLNAQQTVNCCLEELTNAFGYAQRQLLSQAMPYRVLSLALDETFHPSICLVGIEPVSNFILLEQYALRRDRLTWDQAVAQALKDLPVKVIQCVSDQAKALISHTVLTLKANHSPDLFHILHELFKATAICLAARLRAAGAELEQATNQVKELKTRIALLLMDPTAQAHVLKVKALLERAVEQETTAKGALELLISHKQQLCDAIKSISEAYHPFDLLNGGVQTVEQIQARLELIFTTIRKISRDIGLPQRSLDGIEKAYRVVPEMIASIAFVHKTIASRLEGIVLPDGIAALLSQRLIPALYLQRVAKKARTAQKRRDLSRLASELLQELTPRSALWMALEVAQREALHAIALECAQLFQPSSSCVEGRNGYLALFHHGLHHLSDRRMGALTVVHNYHIRDSEGQTPAERFFGRAHDSLFEYLLERMPLPARPAARRSKQTDVQRP